MKKTPQNVPPAEETLPLNQEQEHIRKWLQTVRFRPSLVGGVSEADVWKKIGELNAMYEAALAAERARYDALLQERTRLLMRQMKKKQERVSHETSA